MRTTKNETPVALEIPEGNMRFVDWGGMTIEMGEFSQTVDPSALLAGLPGDACQCPHWGIVLKGSLRYSYEDHVEVFTAGDVYYAPPGHKPVLEAGAEYVEFSPTDELAKTMEVVERNMAQAAH
jgi:hypothetical protein